MKTSTRYRVLLVNRWETKKWRKMWLAQICCVGAKSWKLCSILLVLFSFLEEACYDRMKSSCPPCTCHFSFPFPNMSINKSANSPMWSFSQVAHITFFFFWCLGPYHFLKSAQSVINSGTNCHFYSQYTILMMSKWHVSVIVSFFCEW